MKLLLLLLLNILTITSIYSQNCNSDSLTLALETDTLQVSQKVDVMMELARCYRFASPEKAKVWIDSSLLLSKEHNINDGVRQSYNELFVYYYLKGELDKALEVNTQGALELIERYGEQSAEVAYVNNLFGMIYRNKGMYSKALDYHIKSVEILESKDTSDKRISQKLCSTYNNIAIVYMEQEEYKKGLTYYFKRLWLEKELENEIGIASCYNNIGLTYSSMKDYQKALEFQQKGLDIYLKNNSHVDLCYSYINLAELYLKIEEKELAEEYASSGLNYAIKYNNRQMQIRGYAILGWIDRINKKYTEAIQYGEKSVALAEGYKAIDHSFALEQLYMTYEKSNHLEDAYQTLKSFYTLKDSMINDENRRKTIALEAKYNFEKDKQALEYLAEKEKVTFEAKLEKERLIKYGMFLGILLLTGLLLSSYQTIKIKKENNFKLELLNVELIDKNQEVRNQKEIIEIAHQNITDSLTYAKRIQDAILPSSEEISQYFPQHFIFYKPRNVVSGDFYWMTTHQGKLIFAVADCTGHGVPGAMVSLICNYALNRSVKEYNLTSPDKILNRTRTMILKEFEKSKENIKDGMDIALGVIDGDTLHFAGAYNPLWIIREDELIEIKGDRQPIGKFKQPKPFQVQSVPLVEGDMLYLFSDGIIDQFGGPHNKKYKNKNWRSLLLSIHQHSMQNQKNMVEYAYKEWKGEEAQIDDICVMGIRI